jgi:hypothetical protein
MKFSKFTLGLFAIAALMLSPAASPAQDAFSSDIPMVVATPGPLTAAAPILSTNGPVDILGFFGRGDIDIISSTNAGGTVTATIETSPDTTNWTGLANFALVNAQTAVAITNMYYGSTNLIVTNNYLLPYLPTSPTVYSAGFATPYGNYVSGQLAFTNAAGAITITKAGIYRVGVNLTDSQRYIHIIWSCTGAATNGQTVVGAFIRGNRAFPPK